MEVATNGATLTGIEGMLKPLVRPGGSLSSSLVAGTGDRILAVGKINQERAIQFLLALAKHHSLAAEMLPLKHLDGDGRLAGGVNRQFLSLTTAVNPFVADGDVEESVVVVAPAIESVQGVALYVVGPVVLGVDAAIGQAVGGVLDGILRLLGLGHRTIGGDASIHAPVHIAVEHRFVQAAAHTGLLDGLVSRVGCAGGNDVGIDTRHVPAQDKALLEKGIT